MSSELIEACRELLAMPLMCRWSKETDGLFVPALERARAACAALDRPAPVEGEVSAEQLARAYNPRIWHPDPEKAHQAASPFDVGRLREKQIAEARVVLDRLTHSAPKDAGV